MAEAAQTSGDAQLIHLKQILACVYQEAVESFDTAGEEAFAVWQASAPDGQTEEDDREAFTSEAAFAAVARLTLTDQVDMEPQRLAAGFPHLYSSPLFSWYQPSADIRQKVMTALAELDDPEVMSLLGWLYQSTIPEEIRSRFGQFYTDQKIVDLMLDRAGYKGQKMIGKRLIDPACGAGAFLIEATRRLVQAAAGRAPEEIYSLAQQAIHGLDRNPLSILLTEAALALLLKDTLTALPPETELIPLNLFITDSLDQATDPEAGDELLQDVKNHSGSYADGFDFVIANPPYTKLPSRMLSAEQKERFAPVLYGHPNLYSLFLQLGTELLATKGRLVFINPKSYASGLYFKNLRNYLRQNLEIKSFDLFIDRVGVFEDVQQEIVILTADKACERSDKVRKIELVELKQAGEKPVHKITVPVDQVLLGPEHDHAFLITADPVAHKVFAKTLKAPTLAEAGYKATTGTIVWNRLKDHVRDKDGEDTLPLIWSNAIRPFEFQGLGNRQGKASYLRCDTKTGALAVVGPALLVKRLTSKEERRRIVACAVPDILAASAAGYFVENHVNLIRKVETTNTETDSADESETVSLEVLSTLLNSKLYDYLFRSLNGNTQVSATELMMLPLATDKSAHAKITALVRQLNKDPKDQRLLDHLDQEVYALYQLNAKERKAVEAQYEVSADKSYCLVA